MSRLEYLFMRFGGFDRLFNLLGLAVLAAAFGTLAGRWARDRLKPRRSVPARVTARRAETQKRRCRSGEVTVVNFYAAFETEDGVRREFSVSSEEYSGLVVGDCGTLTYQGGRYLGFVGEQGQGTVEREETEEEEG